MDGLIQHYPPDFFGFQNNYIDFFIKNSCYEKW